MKKIFIFLLLTVIITPKIFAQGVGIGASDFTPDASAILELQATNKGFLPPRLTAAQRTGITGLGADQYGLMVVQTDGAAGMYMWTGASWFQMSGHTLGAIQGFATTQDPLITGWAPLSTGSTVPTATFPAFQAIVAAAADFSGIASISGTDINFVDWNDGQFIRGRATAGVLEGFLTARPTTAFTTSTDGQHIHPIYATDGGAGGGGLPGFSGDNIGRNAFSSNVSDPMGDHSHMITGGGDAETRPVNRSVIWHIYVGIPVKP